MVIADDLPVIVDHLLELFEQQELGLELFPAYSAYEVLRIMEKKPINMVLSDIKMPGMEGIELLSEIQKRWPDCKVVFLTSYGDFQYAKSAISNGAFGYLLKDENDETIIQAVQKAIKQLNKEFDERKKLYDARSQMQRLKPEFIRNIFHPMLQGSPSSLDRESTGTLDYWNIHMNLNAPVWIMIVRVDSWEGWNPSDYRLARFMIQNIVDDYLQDKIMSVCYPFEDSKMIWLLQEKPGDEPFLYSYMSDNLLDMQKKCRELAKLQISIVISASSSEWSRLPKVFNKIRSFLLSKLGSKQEMISVGDLERQSSEEYEEISGRLYKDNAKKLALLRNHLTSCDPNPIMHIVLEFIESIDRVGDAAYKMEIYHALASVFLSYVNHHMADYNWFGNEELNWLTRFDPDITAEQMKQGFVNLVQTIVTCNEKKNIQNEQEVILFIQKYIADHLHEDLSLNRLADLVQFNPSYLSRLYKQETDMGLLSFIQQCRINKAKELLEGSTLKVYEIAEKVGYESRLSFVRMFKSQMGMTPQEYRDLELDPASSGLA
jgi:two-component system response regulator YesN